MANGSFNLSFRSPGSPLQSVPTSSLWHILSHFSGPLDVSEAVSLGPSEASGNDEAIAERLMGVFLAMMEHQQTRLPPGEVANSGIWEMSRHEFHGELYRLVAAHDVPGLADYMRNAMQTKLTHGLGPGLQVFEAMCGGGDGLQANVLIILDRLASLAESLGILGYENPEQGRYGVNLGLPAAELVAMIEDRLGYRIGRPAVMGAFGVQVGDQVFDARVPDDAYSVERMRVVMQSSGLGAVAEIGGGLGGCAVQAIRAGLPSYTIFDLPVVLLVQGWMTMRTFGPDMVEMFSESAPAARIRLRPYWEFNDPAHEFGLVFNRDSLPEIPQQHAEGYVAEIARRGCALLSINQESLGYTDSVDVRQLWVHDMVRRDKRLRCVARHPYWHRRGYVEELFLPAPG